MSAGDPQKPSAPSALKTRMLKKKRRSFWVNAAAVAATLLIVAGSIFWLTAFHFYIVGSNSMAPALLSTPGDRDRLLCWTLAYKYRKPVRWEVSTFETPEIGEDRDIIPGMATGGETGLTVKRIAGLENERLAIAGGDIWTRPLRSNIPFERQVKPDSVQKGMWIEVYREDFTDISAEEFLRSWELSGNDSVGITGGILRLQQDVTLRYLPVSRTGSRASRSGMTVLPGIPDRYILPQEVIFVCSECGTEFSLYISSQNIRGRCPACRHLNEETSVRFYTLRSGLPEVGRYHAGDVPQGDTSHFRTNSYHFVADLKVTLDLKLPGNGEFEIGLLGENRTALFTAGGGKMRLNGRELPSPETVRPGEWTRIEFYVVEGTVRLYLGEKRREVFDRMIWKTEMPAPDFDGGESGVVLSTRGGGAEIRNLAIHRDVHYFSGREMGMGGYLDAMEENGQIDLPPGSFFPLGDNSTVSLDGRSWGAVSMDLLRGTAIAVWSPKERRGRIPSP